MMRSKLRSAFAFVLLLSLVLPGAVLAERTRLVGPPPFINEIHYDNDGTDAGEAIEIAGPAGTDLSGWSLVLYNGNGGAAYNTTSLSGLIPDQGGGFGTVVVNYPVNGLQNGSPDGIALADDSGTLVMFISYEGTFTAVGGPADGMLSTDIGVSEPGPLDYSLQLTGTGSAYGDFTWAAPALNTFGAFNTGQTFLAGGPTDLTGVGAADPESVSPGDDSLLTVTVTPGTEPDSTGITVVGDLSAIGGSAAQDFFDNGTNGDETAGDLVFSYQATVDAATAPADYLLPVVIADLEGRSSETTIKLIVTACGDPFTPIYEIQGGGMASPLANSLVETEGVVVGDFQIGGKNGFFIQDAAGDADATTSDGVFVYAPGGMDVNVGDEVRVHGEVNEYYGLTQIKNVSDLWLCSTGNSIAPTNLSLPVLSVDDFEPYEGMLVTFPQQLYISEYYNFDRYGEIVLTSDRQYQPTHVFDPGSSDAADLANDNILGRITLDDGRTSQNPDPAIHPNGSVFDLTNLFRGGDTLADVTGVMDYSFDLYRIQPTQGADYTAANPRPEQPDDVGDRVKVAAFNVLNYFTTLDAIQDDSGPNNPADDICGPAADQECRGADTALEFERQRAKIISALAAINADVVGLIEIENYPGDVPTEDLVSGLNDVMGAGTYDYVATGAIGSDAIRVALIYKPATISLIGEFAILDSTVDPDFLDDYNRPVLAQTFIDNVRGGIFTVAVNHLKSKGSDCNDVGDLDLGDGSGNCNLTRKAAAEALVDWLATDPTSSGDEDFLIIGDLNSYAKEDPIDVLLAGGYTDLVQSLLGDDEYSYVFDGQLGYLDYSLAGPGLMDELTGATIWHINADEPDLIDYDMSFKKPAQDALYADDAYRASDHDPVITGLDVCDEIPPEITEFTLTPNVLWPPNHKYVDVTANVVVVDNFDPNPTLELVLATSNEPDDDKGDGKTINDVVVVDDTTFKLRAERSGRGIGRVYSITYKATDDCGNSAQATGKVFVPHDMASLDEIMLEEIIEHGIPTDFDFILFPFVGPAPKIYLPLVTR